MPRLLANLRTWLPAALVAPVLTRTVGAQGALRYAHIEGTPSGLEQHVIAGSTDASWLEASQ